MGLMEMASGRSLWRGYDYYKSGNVLSFAKVSEIEYTGVLQGNENRKYEVWINTEHPRQSHCNCPHANGKRVICKHQIALYFSAFPRAAEKYYQEVVAYEEEEERRQEELDRKVTAYIRSLSKEELRETLYEVLYDSEDWVFERFVREHIEDF